MSDILNNFDQFKKFFILLSYEWWVCNILIVNIVKIINHYVYDFYVKPTFNIVSGKQIKKILHFKRFPTCWRNT